MAVFCFPNVLLSSNNSIRKLDDISDRFLICNIYLYVYCISFDWSYLYPEVNYTVVRVDVTLATAVHWNEYVNSSAILEQGSPSSLMHQRQCRQRSNGNKITINRHECDFFLVRSNGQTCIYYRVQRKCKVLILR